jgi:hypothetical protein
VEFDGAIYHVTARGNAEKGRKRGHSEFLGEPSASDRLLNSDG